MGGCTGDIARVWSPLLQWDHEGTSEDGRSLNGRRTTMKDMSSSINQSSKSIVILSEMKDAVGDENVVVPTMLTVQAGEHLAASGNTERDVPYDLDLLAYQ
ncbi:hypothetical protein ANCCAN_21031 [Ancylostoma caninum]|uniref:Uncharacterized protein n=1 Tax=Ancylostoma caninum TaxID=29170 RepID=A0A368FQR5_ANCCA|nr:hypothetical protein ANCCAN_21031 [Ancylostoma caninum]